MRYPCHLCNATGVRPTLGGSTATCMLCGGTGYVEEADPAPHGSALSPEILVSLLCGAAAAYLAYRDGSMSLSEAWGVAIVVAVVVQLTIAKLIARVMAFAIRVGMVIGLIAALAYCSTQP